MNEILYPLRFAPIYQYLLWGQRVAGPLTAPLLGGGLSAKRGYLATWTTASQIAWTAKGRTLGQLLVQFPEQLLGKLAQRFRRFPLHLISRSFWPRA
jgi:mannose-6-phosphate isomerase